MLSIWRQYYYVLWSQVVTSLTCESVSTAADVSEDNAHSDRSPASPSFHRIAKPRPQLAGTAQDPSSNTEADSTAAGNIAVHKFPVDKQLLLQMRFRQMYGRTSASLVRTPAKALPQRSSHSALVSASHVGPATSPPPQVHSSSPVQHELDPGELVILPLDRQRSPTQLPREPNPAARWPDRPQPPHFELLRRQQDAAAVQQPDSVGKLVQHDMADPDVYSQWPESPEMQADSRMPLPLPLQQMHSLAQPLPSYAWTTEQLTAIAAAAATAAATAVQHETKLAEEADKAAQRMAAGALNQVIIRPNVQALATEQALLSSIPTAKDAPDSSELAESSQKPQQTVGVQTVLPASARQANHEQQLELSEPKMSAPKQSNALRKLKHRASTGRSSTSHKPCTQATSPNKSKSPAANVDAAKHGSQLTEDKHKQVQVTKMPSDC